MAQRVTQRQWDAKRAEVKAKAREALLQDAEDEATPVPEELNEELKAYADMTDEELDTEVTERQFDVTGITSREELIAALEAADEQ